MRYTLSIDWSGRLGKLDYRKIIIVALALRIVSACAYDVFVSVSKKDILLPDSSFYSATGYYLSLLFLGYDKRLVNMDMLPADSIEQGIVFDRIMKDDRDLLQIKTDANIFFYAVATIYTFFGHFPLGVRLFNIALSIASVYFIFKIAKRQFDEPVATVFLLIALFLPSHFIYSITLSRDFIRVFIVSLILWRIYG